MCSRLNSWKNPLLLRTQNINWHWLLQSSLESHILSNEINSILLKNNCQIITDWSALIITCFEKQSHLKNVNCCLLDEFCEDFKTCNLFIFFSFENRVKFIFGLNSNNKVAIKAQRCLQIILRNVFLRKFTVTILVNYTNDSANIECWGFKLKLDSMYCARHVTKSN